MEDIASLRDILEYQLETITLTDKNEVEALKVVLNSDSSPPGLQEIIKCEAIWPTT